MEPMKHEYLGITNTPLTVGDLIQRLQTFDPSARAMIHDADTDWLLDILEVIEREESDLGKVICVRGDYYP